MKTIIIFFCVFILITMVVQADVYVKGTQNVETRYHHGSLYPEYASYAELGIIGTMPSSGLCRVELLSQLISFSYSL